METLNLAREVGQVSPMLDEGLVNSRNEVWVETLAKGMTEIESGVKPC